MTVIAILSLVAVVFGIASWHLLPRVDTRAWSVGAAVLLWSVGLGVKLVDQDVAAGVDGQARQTSRLAALPIESLAWPGDNAPKQSTTIAASSVDAAPIASLVEGLEERLVREPDDAKGWALLAQSYAFIGKVDAAEQALARAVELGMDEQALRERIDAAAERAPHGSWIQQAIGG